MKIAVIGSGISGLSAAYYLSKKFKVDLFEQEDYFGGHSCTYDIKKEKKTIPVDLGFIVFNELTYPNLLNFFKELEVPFEKSDMSFAVSIQGSNIGHLAYSVKNIYDVCDRLMKSGVTINRPPRDGHMAFVRSPDGISIEILQEGESLSPQEPWLSMENTGSW